MKPWKVSAADVEWIDRYGHAQVYGRLFTHADIRSVESPQDRRDDGHLTVAAKQRLAIALTRHLHTRTNPGANAEAGTGADELGTDQPPVKHHDRDG